MRASESGSAPNFPWQQFVRRTSGSLRSRLGMPSMLQVVLLHWAAACLPYLRFLVDRLTTLPLWVINPVFRPRSRFLAAECSDRGRAT